MNSHLSQGFRDNQVETKVGRLAARQHGVVTADQLATLGIGPKGVEHRLLHARLIRLHRGVYAVGYRRHHQETAFAAAVLACGEGALLSHLAAGALWQFVRWPERAPVDVTVAGRNVRSRRGIRVHRVRCFEANGIDEEMGIPVTAPAVTLLDLATVLPADRLLRAVNQALVRQRVTEGDLVSLVASRSRRCGAHRLRELLLGLGVGPTRSRLEDLGLQLVAEHDLPRASSNHKVWAGGREREIDLAWPAERLAVELDSARYHGNPAARAIDQAKADALRSAGWRVLRFSWVDTAIHPAATARRIRIALDSTTVSQSP